MIADSIIGLKRIQKFLQEEELDSLPLFIEEDTAAIRLNSCSFSWVFLFV